MRFMMIIPTAFFYTFLIIMSVVCGLFSGVNRGIIYADESAMNNNQENNNKVVVLTNADGGRENEKFYGVSEQEILGEQLTADMESINDIMREIEGIFPQAEKVRGD